MITFSLIHPKSSNGIASPLSIMEEQHLINGLRHASSQAFRELYMRYSANLMGVIVKIVNQIETAEDLLQEVFIKVRRNFHLYDEAKAKLFTWLLNIARNTAIDHLRLKSSRQDKANMVLEDAGYLLRGYTSAMNTDTIGVKKLIDSLPLRHRLLVDLCYFKGYSHTEIAEYLEMPLGSVKTTIRQAILRLRVIYQVDKLR